MFSLTDEQFREFNPLQPTRTKLSPRSAKVPTEFWWLHPLALRPNRRPRPVSDQQKKALTKSLKNNSSGSLDSVEAFISRHCR